MLAAAIGVPGIAAWLALEQRARLRPGETVLVLGAGGAGGRLALQVAKPLGAARVVAADRKPERLAQAQALGADAGALIVPGEAFEEALRAAAPEGIGVVVDFLWGEVTPRVIPILKYRRPRIAQVGSAAGGVAPLTAAVFRNKLISLIGHSNFLFDAPGSPCGLPARGRPGGARRAAARGRDEPPGRTSSPPGSG